MKIVSPELIKLIADQSFLPNGGYHGLDHWVRVLNNGRKLAKLTGANLKVVELFAFFHDSKRLNEGHDPDHGSRGGQFASAMRGQCFDASHQEMEILMYACEYHSNGLTEGDVTVQTCWDADRIDLGRVGKFPDPKFLCTDAAKQPRLIEQANERAVWRFSRY